MVCSRDALPTCSPQHVIPSGATLRLACQNSTSVSTVGADLYGMDRMHCDNGQWQPADFPVCFDRCLIDHHKLNFSGLNISDGQLTGGNTLRSGYSFTVECKDLDATLMGLGTLYCLDGELVPSTLPICIPHGKPDAN
ncbi:uncharacterized protein LOC110977707 [Acanthaster planci]|uniref:Uncharacterized protein LOC110977707 n=1 Tax=Acanthaster planci TaxID=133434 RepID=A0A8B7Y5X1_ACAPL|nr:uncharacterized protein LOC110977707 [Acanthaster planci]